MKFKLSAIAAAVAAATLSTAASAAAVDFHGYMRSGVGASSEGGQQTCFKLAGALTKYRLGNECETYSELAFDVNAWKSASSEAYASLHTMMALSVDQKQDWEGATPAWRQAWVEFGNVGSGALAKAKLWAGKRYYQRHDIHIVDFYYWDNSGPGAGIEDITFGDVKLSYAWRQNLANENEALRSHDVRANFPLGDDFGSMDVGLQYAQQDNRGDSKYVDPNNKSKGERDSGYMLTVQHFMPGVLGGFNKAAFQYGTGPLNELNGTYPSYNPGKTYDNSDKSAWRFVDQLVFDSGAWNGQAFFGYEDRKSTRKWLSLGVRPVYHFNELYSVAVEYGFDQVKWNSGYWDAEASQNAPGQVGKAKTGSMHKFTVAGQISAGKSFWARPQLRAFLTYAKWNDAAAGWTPWGTSSGVGAYVDGNGKTNGSGVTYGAQAEMWW